MNIRIYSLKRAGQTNRSSQREGYLAEQCKMLGGTVKSLVFEYEVKKYRFWDWPLVRGKQRRAVQLRLRQCEAKIPSMVRKCFAKIVVETFWRRYCAQG